MSLANEVDETNGLAMLVTSEARPRLLRSPDMFSVSTSPSVSNSRSFADDMLRLEQDITASQMRREAELLIQQREDLSRCIGCGDITEGTKILGSHVQICPDCLAAFVERESARELVPA
jgi:hypothetical protein